MHLVNTRLDRVDVHVRRRLRSATFPNGYLRRFMRAEPRAPIVIVHHRRQLMGWGLVLDHRSRPRLSLYVNVRYRRRGVATTIILSQMRRFGHILVTAWEEASSQTFRGVQRRHPKRLTIVDWYAHKSWYDRFLEQRKVQVPR